MYLATFKDVGGKNYIVSRIGEDCIRDFESWAFGTRCPIEYDESARFLWNYTHRANSLTGSLEDAFKRMVELWNEKNI